MTEHWLRLANLQLQPRLANSLLEAFGQPDRLFAASVAEIEAAGGFTDKQTARILDPTFVPTQAQWDYVARASVRAVGRSEPDYPRSLLNVVDGPPVILMRGTLEERDRFAVGLVGTRHASAYGRSVTARMARDLVGAGLTIVSGGAIGIDSVAHRATLEAGGRTLVVLGCGLDVPYPRESQGLFDQVVARNLGAVLTEFPLGAAPEPWRFPARNRIISGLSMGVVVVEAGAQSGALLTAGIAADQGREVMAVPGNIDNPYARGTNGLLRDGAALVEGAPDVLQALGILALKPPPGPPPSVELSPAQRRLIECLSLSPKHIDALAVEAGLAPTDTSVQLTMLELSGIVRRLPGNTYIRVL
jgi:DNA processing protein